MLKGYLHRRNKPVEILPEVLASRGGLHSFPENGQYRALHGLRNGAVGLFHPVVHSLRKSLHTGLGEAFQPLGYPCEYA